MTAMMKFRPEGPIVRRRCPRCRARVPWSRWLCKSGIWVRWPCASCGSMLQFDLGRRLRMSVFFGLMLLMPPALAILLGTWAIVVFLLLLVAASPLLLLLDAVRLVRDAPSVYCTRCRYDLRGVLDRDEPVCPECGGALPPAARAALDVADRAGVD